MIKNGSQPGFPAPKSTKVAFVTGAAGFIGGHVVAALEQAGWTVAGIGNARSDTVLKTGTSWFNGAVSEDLLRAAEAAVGQPELIVHAAGGATVGASLADPARDFERTVSSTVAVLSFMRSRARLARLIFLSSAAVYGHAGEGPIAENTPPAPISPYGLHKRISEDLIRGWARLYDLDAVIIRLFSVYGPGIRKQLIWELTRQLMTGPASLTLFGRGDEIRDFLFVDDVVRMIGCLVRTDRQPETPTVNAGSGRAVTVRQLAGIIRDAVGQPTMIEFNGTVREGDPKSLLADLTLARQFGFEPTVPLEQGIASYLAWVKSLMVTAG